MEITLPVIHLNGTSARMLFEDNRRVAHKIEDAIDELKKMEFHSRDYYPNDSWKKAHTEFNSRWAALNEARNYFLAVALHAQEHIKK